MFKTFSDESLDLLEEKVNEFIETNSIEVERWHYGFFDNKHTMVLEYLPMRFLERKNNKSIDSASQNRIQSKSSVSSAGLLYDRR